MDRLPFLATSTASPYAELRLPVALFLHHVHSMYDLGAFFRSADGAGIERIFLSGITARPPMKAISKTALGSDEWVPWTAVEGPLAEWARLRGEGREITPKAKCPCG
jgi:23S rRNA (guanosine2251-2'-O)-methyltransferase